MARKAKKKSTKKKAAAKGKGRKTKTKRKAAATKRSPAKTKRTKKAKKRADPKKRKVAAAPVATMSISPEVPSEIEDAAWRSYGARNAISGLPSLNSVSLPNLSDGDTASSILARREALRRSCKS